jgi:hypothetical protein
MITKRQAYIPTPEQFLEDFPSDMQALANALRDIIRETVPQADEQVYTGWRVLGYRLYEGKRRIYWGFVHPTLHYVSIGFEWGILLPDPQGILEGDELKQVRFITLRDAESIPREPLIALIREAVRIAPLPVRIKRQRWLEQQEIARLERGVI